MYFSELDKNLSSEEEQGWLDDREEEHPKVTKYLNPFSF
jgi:hypothetical protein